VVEAVADMVLTLVLVVFLVDLVVVHLMVALAGAQLLTKGL
jgi:hypothetical protein